MAGTMATYISSCCRRNHDSSSVDHARKKVAAGPTTSLYPLYPHRNASESIFQSKSPALTDMALQPFRMPTTEVSPAVPDSWLDSHSSILFCTGPVPKGFRAKNGRREPNRAEMAIAHAERRGTDVIPTHDRAWPDL